MTARRVVQCKPDAEPVSPKPFDGPTKPPAPRPEPSREPKRRADPDGKGRQSFTEPTGLECDPF